MDKKTIELYPFHKTRHSLHKEVIEFLKERYNIIYNPRESARKKENLFFRHPRFFIFRKLYHHFFRRFLRWNDIYFKFIKKEHQKPKFKDSLLYSIAEVPPFKNDYIIDFERVNSLADHDHNRLDKKYIEEKFSEDNCKSIIPWYNIAERSLRETIDCSKFSHKIKTIPFGIKSDPIKKNYNKKTVDLIFVSSINNPLDFEFKGGIIALEAYKKLVYKFPNISFTLRTCVPKWVKEKYGNLPRIKFIESFISREELNNLMENADIFLQPKLGTQLALESMNYAIPAVTLDEWEMLEMIIHGKNGFNIDSSLVYGPKKTKEDLQKYLKNYHINHLKMYNRNPPKKIVDDFVEKTSLLIEKKDLREKMGEYAKSLVEKNGKYNFDKMKSSLLQVFEDAMR